MDGRGMGAVGNKAPTSPWMGEVERCREQGAEMVEVLAR